MTLLLTACWLTACSRGHAARDAAASASPAAAVAPKAAPPQHAVAASASVPAGAPGAQSQGDTKASDVAAPSAAPVAQASGPAVQASAPVSEATASGAAEPAAAGPKIYSIETSPSVVHAGGAVVWDVRTTPNIVTVTAHVSAYTIPLHRTAPGHFALNFTVPSNVPGFFRGVYNLDVTARTENGASASRTVSMSFQ